MSLITAEGGAGQSGAGQSGAGQGYQAIPLPRSPVGDAALLATMIRRSCGKQTRRAVLYVHCLRDSFVPPELAVWYLQRGFHFYVVDLRAARPHGREATLAEYFGCLDLAARQIRDTDGNDTVLVSAHRAGAVIAALWCHTRREAGRADALILADPEFGPDQRWLGRLLAAWSPAATAPGGTPEGRTAELLPHAQRRLRRGLDIACPVLVINPPAATPQPSSSPTWTTPTRAAARSGPPARLGAHVTWLRLDAGDRTAPTDDRETRKRLHEELRRWLGAYLSAEIRDQLL
ncbi:MAG TPA: hypothetical protein VGH27_31990 [Streptosporangiaceae bacterium]|jgi:hypothetical protein